MFCSNCGNEIEENEKFCSVCGTEVKKRNKLAVKKGKASISVDEETSDNILNFLDKAQILETRKYGLEQALNELNSDIAENSVESVSQKLSKAKMKDFKNKGFKVISIIFAIFVGSVYVVNQAVYGDLQTFKDVMIKVWLVAYILGFVAYFAFYSLILFLRKTLKNKMIDRKQSKLDLDASNENEDKKLKLKELNIQLQTIEKEEKETEELLEKLYDLDIIYKKYHNLVAITTFYEYFKSGRCNSLQGYTGAYNIYEQEIRQNVIIEKLDEVLQSMEQVKKNQFALYTAIQQGNQIQMLALKNSLELVKLTREGVANSREIAESTRKTEYYTKRTEENTDILTFIETMEAIKK